MRRDCSGAGTCMEIVIATGISMAAVAVFSIHMDRKAAMPMTPNSSHWVSPRDATMVRRASRRATPCLRSASAMNKLPRMRKTTGREKGSKACGVLATPRATRATGTIRAAIGKETGSRARILAVNTKAARACCPSADRPGGDGSNRTTAVSTATSPDRPKKLRNLAKVLDRRGRRTCLFGTPGGSESLMAGLFITDFNPTPAVAANCRSR